MATRKVRGPSSPVAASSKIASRRPLSLAKLTLADVEAFSASIERQLSAATSAERAAGHFVRAFFEAVRSTILVRVFMTVRFSELPPLEYEYAARCARESGSATRLKPDTPVLVLLATRGEDGCFDHRHLSRGHLAIPLTDAAFVRSVPMIAALLEALGGVPLDVFNTPRSRRSNGRARSKSSAKQSSKRRLRINAENGLFLANDPLEAKNERTVRIFDPTFVKTRRVRSVLGFGGVYLTGATLAVIVFSREQVPRRNAERLALLGTTLKLATYNQVATRQMFDVGALESIER